MRQSKKKCEMMLKDETPGSKSTQIVIGEKQRTGTNNTIANNTTGPKL